MKKGLYFSIMAATLTIILAVNNSLSFVDKGDNKQEKKKEDANPKGQANGAGEKSENIVKNPSFEEGKDSPSNWDEVDGLTTFWVDRDDEEGKCIKFDTDVYLEEAKARRKEMKIEKKKRPIPKPKTPIKGKGYNTVGGTTGAYLYSKFIEIKKDKTYRLTVDVKSTKPAIKVFIKGYAMVKKGKSEERREVYKCYKNCGGGKQDWTTYTRIFHPTKRTPNVKWIRVMLFAYWPRGAVWFDDIEIVEVDDIEEDKKDQKKPPKNSKKPDSNDKDEKDKDDKESKNNEKDKNKNNDKNKNDK